MIMKCKPTYQFQSIEFDYEIDDKCGPVAEQDIKDMFALYQKVLKGLMDIAPVQDQRTPAPKTPQDPPATQRQKDTMDLYGIDYPDNITSKQAQALIQRSIHKG